MNITRTRQICAALAMVAWSSMAYADYLCETKERDPTPQQKELFARGAAAMRAALLPPPEGWRMQDPATRTPSGKFCPDFKNDPVTFGASVLYIIPPTLEQSIAYIEDDELVEVTPKSIRLRKQVLNPSLRKRRAKEE